MKKLVLATTNLNKVKEYNAILKKHGIKVVGLPIMKDVNETGKTFKSNALLKVKAASKLTDLPVIADDSGLCISALHGFPGIHSARYAKQLGGFEIANEGIVKRLHKNRKAYFACAIALANVKSKPIVFEAKAFGTIAEEFKGDKGFGYDPIFIPNGYKKTYAKLPKVIKNKISHRAKACKILVNYLR